MGEMVMKDIFSRDSYLFPSFEAKAKKQSVIIAILLGVFFLAAAFCFMNTLYCFADIIGSIVSGSPDVAIHDLLRALPVFLSVFMTIWALLLFHGQFRNVNEEKRVKSLKKNAIALLAFGGITIIYVIVGRITGTYLSLVEGSPSWIYPLDAMLYALLYIAIGVLALLYAKKAPEKLAYVVPSRGPIAKKARFVYCLFVAFWMLIALFSFAGFWTGLFIIDFAHGYALFSVALLLVYLTNACFLICWEFLYNELKEEARKKLLLPVGVIATAIAAIVAGFYFIALGLNLDGPSNVGFGVLPVTFAASVNIATMIVVATPLIVGVTATIKGILIRKAK